MSYNVKNYTEQGGEKTVIGGTLEVKDGATVTGIVPVAAAVAASTATDVAGVNTVLNAVIASLKAAGLMAAE